MMITALIVVFYYYGANATSYLASTARLMPGGVR